MRNQCGVAALACLVTATFIGCGGESSSKTETVPFKQTDASQFQDMLPKKPAERTKAVAPPKAATP